MWNEDGMLGDDSGMDGLGMVDGMIEDVELERIALIEQQEDEEFKRRENEVRPSLTGSMNAWDYLESMLGWDRIER